MLTVLIQDENRETKNIYLKITYGNRKKNGICFLGTYILPCMSTFTYIPDSNICGFPSVGKI